MKQQDEREREILDKAGAEHKTIFVVDWDGVCTEAMWPEWGDWLPGAPEALAELLTLGEVRISSARINPHKFGLDGIELRDPADVDVEVKRMRDMLDEKGLYGVVIHTTIGKPSGTYYIDDRAVEFKGDWQSVLARFRGPTEVLPTGSQARKDIPLTTGVLDYFPAALAEVARVSKQGNDKHNPGEPLHWARGKSMDQADCISRHLLERGGIDPDTGMRHSAQLAWRALALLQIELEEAGEAPLARGATA